MNLDMLPNKYVRPTKKTENQNSVTGERLVFEMLTQMSLGDASQARKALERSVLQVIQENLKKIPKTMLDMLKQPPYAIDLESGDSPGLQNFTQLVSNTLSMDERWKDRLQQAKKSTEAGGRPDLDTCSELYRSITKATQAALRAAYEKR